MSASIPSGEPKAKGASRSAFAFHLDEMCSSQLTASSVRSLGLDSIYAENVVAKILQVARRSVHEKAPLPSYPHTVPQSGPAAGAYEYREADFWTCGFFPGSIYALLERAVKYPKCIRISGYPPAQIGDELLKLGRHWSVAISQMSGRTDTHDMGFIVQPALQKDFELTGNKESLESVTKAAYALASRWDERVQAIRSWDVAINDRYSITDMEENFLVIIDSMCNLDLLYYVGHVQQDQRLIDLATQHATTIMREILRPDHSSYHLVNFDPRTGKAQAKMTNQGYSDESTWTRGQAWAIMGFAQTYMWTKDPTYLDTAMHCAQYFLRRLEEGRGRWPHTLVPVWDFDGYPGREVAEPLRDVSAGVIAANGLVMLHQAMEALSPAETSRHENLQREYLDAALGIVNETLDLALDLDFARFEPASTEHGEVELRESGFDSILRHATSNNNEHAHKPYQDHGLVYADYYLLEFGNKLLRAGLI